MLFSTLFSRKYIKHSCTGCILKKSLLLSVEGLWEADKNRKGKNRKRKVRDVGITSLNTGLERSLLPKSRLYLIGFMLFTFHFS